MSCILKQTIKNSDWVPKKVQGLRHKPCMQQNKRIQLGSEKTSAAGSALALHSARPGIPYGPLGIMPPGIIPECRVRTLITGCHAKSQTTTKSNSMKM